ncbi:MAG: SlyX family protein [Aestuariivirga sp.]|uniref:SlyX family protein n=1 Tax=Aestuariivirga sp. TaxID=2650926 RepID=UPI003016B636
MPADEHHGRMADMERRIAEQDRVIADLNDMVVAQWRKIDNLDRRLGELREEFDASAAGRPDGREPPPPHY